MDLDDPKNAALLPSTPMKLIGHDSEFFLWNTAKQTVVPSWPYYPMQQDAKLVRLEGYLRFKKKYYQDLPPEVERPWGYTAIYPCTTGYGGQAKLFRDGLAVEVNISPATCRAYIWNDTRIALLRGEPPRMSPKLAFTTRPWVEVTPKLMEKFPQDLRVLGCSASMDAYKQRTKVVAVDPEKTFFRTCGSHLHMSFYNHSKERPVPSSIWSPFIKLSDLTLGLLSVAIFGDELERKRRTLYGQAGEFRFQPSYGGLEYRVLSSRIWNHQALWSLFAGIWKFVLGGGFIPQLYAQYDRAWEDDICQAINEVNVEKATELLKFPDAMLMKLTRDLQYTNIAKLPTWGLVTVAKKFRELYLRGIFPDAGIWSRPFAPTGDLGFQNYWRKWEHTPASEVKDLYGLHYTDQNPFNAF